MVKEIALTSSQGQSMIRMTSLMGSGVPQRHVMIKAPGGFALFANFMAGPRTGTTWGASAQRAGTTKSSHWSLIVLLSLFSRDFPPQSLSGWVSLPYLLNYVIFNRTKQTTKEWLWSVFYSFLIKLSFLYPTEQNSEILAPWPPSLLCRGQVRGLNCQNLPLWPDGVDSIWQALRNATRRKEAKPHDQHLQSTSCSD